MSGRRAKVGERTDERRGQLVEAAYETLVRTGLAQLRTRDIAAAAGITVATLHYYFPTKEDLVRVVLEYAIRVRIVDMLKIRGPRPDGLAGLRAMLSALRKQSVTEPGHFRLLHEMVFAAQQDPDLAALLRQWHGNWHTEIRRLLDTAVAAGDARADLDCAATATMIIYLIFGMVLRPPLPSPPLPAEPGEQVIDQIERLLT